MEELQNEFRERCLEIIKYLDTIHFIEEQGVEVISRNGSSRMPIDTTTKHVLKASVFLHLYNLVESTFVRCLDRVCEEIENTHVTFADLTDEWRKAWLREVARTNISLNPENRLRTLLAVCEDLSNGVLTHFRPSLSGGNLDDVKIEELSERHGIVLNFGSRVYYKVKRHVMNDHGPLKLVRLRRNELAHGQASFRDCGRNVSVRELRSWAATIIRYLREVIRCFKHYITTNEFNR